MELGVFYTKTHQRISDLGLSVDRSGLSRSSSTMHTNRVFSIKFHPVEPNIVFSAGWDKTVQFWDLRAAEPLCHLTGPFVCGDTLDVDPARNQLLVGSYRVDNNLQVISFYFSNKIKIKNEQG